MTLMVACDHPDCAEHGAADEFYQLRIEQPYEDYGTITRWFCEDHIAEFDELLPGTTYVPPEEVFG